LVRGSWEGYGAASRLAVPLKTGSAALRDRHRRRGITDELKIISKMSPSADDLRYTDETAQLQHVVALVPGRGRDTLCVHRSNSIGHRTERLEAIYARRYCA
jgi:hypothetical protein